MEGGNGGKRGQYVGKPEFFGNLGDARRHFIFFVQTGYFGFEKLRAADAEHGQDGDCEDDDAHAAEPVEEVPPKVDGRCERVEVCDGGRAGGGQSGHGLKEGVGKAYLGQVEVNRYGGNKGKGKPQHQDEGKAVPRTQFPPESQSGYPNGVGTGHGNQGGGEEGGKCAVRKGIGQRGRYQQDDGKQKSQPGEDVCGWKDLVHGAAVFIS